MRIIRVDERDNVAIPTADLAPGTSLECGLAVRSFIPQGHKIALADLPEGSAVVRYGVALGHLLQPVKAGDLISETMLRQPESPDLDSLEFGTDIFPDLPEPPVSVFDGYPVEGSPYGGTRNILGIMTTVQCVAGVLNTAVERMRKELLPLYPAVDDIVPLNHPYGCGVAIDAPEAKIPIRTLRNLLRNPNFGGELMVVGLGCEKLTVERLLEPGEISGENVLLLQDHKGFVKMTDALLEMAERKLKRLNERRRRLLPLSALCVGMQCGGSDAFSGITANPAAGYASDLLVGGGATVMFSEVTEVRDGVRQLAARCADASVGRRLAEEMRWYDDYLRAGGVDRSANPTPGNKKGGLANIIEKAMGSIAKSGRSPVAEVLSPGERPSKRGLIYASTPASDMVCGTCQLASGMTLQVFMTGRGTPYGLAAAPVIKVSSRTDLKGMWSDLIDVDAGVIASGEATIREVGELLFREIVDTASGRKRPWAEKYRLHNDLCLFNPAPIT
ncbi:galactarate dehydratase [Aminivibrio sp.]|jgi:galactarate dehydratase|uniref:galactarate dehydratase n=1 Tax=Aminivibrio sp. TaxID=1872489 RepID=UPI001A3F7173|nr:galactarate dehydratase [Aminivibrio sp.]MBL3539759.1 galactarate dehydratase [Aminivibrio sp.]MDK2958066.1 galactarate dehydratase [Synergistaceae bacterium]